MANDNEFPEVALIKHAIRDFKKEIREEQTRIENTSYMFLPEEKPKDKARVEGMVYAKIFFEKYYKKYLHQQKEEKENG